MRKLKCFSNCDEDCLNYCWFKILAKYLLRNLLILTHLNPLNLPQMLKKLNKNIMLWSFFKVQPTTSTKIKVSVNV